MKLSPICTRIKVQCLVGCVVILQIFHGLAAESLQSNTVAQHGNISLHRYFKSEDCEPLPPPPPEEDEPELDLLYLLTRGSEFLQNYTETINATLLLGNTGAGKSTVAQILAGDLSRLHVVEAPGDQLVIIDDDNRIGLPSIKSKTLIPDLVIKTEDDTSLALYDCPGFDDTRGPVPDIAANFFMNPVSGRITNVKMLFLVIHSSIKLGHDRIDFDKLATHATTFVKNIEKYKQSFGLLVTKVDSFNNRGQYIEDNVIIEQIVEFLNMYNQTLHSDYSASGSAEENATISKKIIFVESLLKIDSTTGNYSKIWFVRSPLECGPLSEMQMIIDTKNNITHLHEKLVSTKVDADNDFGFTLKDNSLLHVGNYTASINADIANATARITDDLQKQYFRLKIDPKLEDEDLKNLFNFIKVPSSEFYDTVDNLLLNTSDVTKFVENFKKVWTLLGLVLPNKFTNFLTFQEDYLVFFDKVTEKDQDRLFKIWTEPLVKFRDTYKHHMAWYEFCLHLESRVISYEFHANKPRPPSNINPYEWFDYIATQGFIEVSDQVLNAHKFMRKSDLKLLDHLMTFGLKTPEKFCLANQGALVIHSNFLRVQEILPDIQSCVSNITRLEIYASHTIFVDVDLTLYDRDLVLMAPIMDSFSQTQKTVLLEGSTKSRRDIKSFAQIQNQSINSKSIRGDGAHGQAGMPGNPGGTLFALLDSILTKISFTSQAGFGGDGEDGGAGTTCGEVCNCLGCSGGNGGDGGKEGKGANFSELTMVELKESSNVVLKKSVGNEGRPGSGGRGITWSSGINFCDSFDRCKCLWERNCAGADGRSGVSEIGLKNPDLPRTLSAYSYILYYTVNFFSSTNTKTIDFFHDIETSKKVEPYFTLKALAEESLALENIEKTMANRNRLADTFYSLASKLKTFANQHYNSLTEEHKKILRMLQSSSYSSYVRLRSSSALPVITDISVYFTIIKRQIESIKQLEVYNAINDTRNKFKEEIIMKINHASNLIETTASAAINQTGNEIEATMVSLEQTIVNLILDAEKSLEECKTELKRAERRNGLLKFFKITEMFGKVASLVLPGGKAWSTVTSMLSKLGTQFAGKPNDLERLQELSKEIESLIRELKDQQDKFEEEFVPFVDSFFAYLRNVSDSLASGKDIAAPDLAVTKWQITTKLKECKLFLEDLAESSISTKPLKNAFDRIQDAFMLSIELYEMIDRYLDTINLADYIASLQSAELYPVPIENSELFHNVAKFELTVKRNLFDQEAQKAIHGFKQWVFPFAKFYTLEPTSSETGDEQIENVERLEFELAKYKAYIVGEHDTFIIQMNFSSNLKTSKPFYTWDNENWGNEISSLFSGSKVYLNADVRLQEMVGWEAIKFKQIEINFKLNHATSEMQAEFDDLIEYFGISMTHSGISYYRFQQEYFVMTGSNQTLLYNFEVDARGNRLGTNLVYEKFKMGDYMLSPYTLWTVQLFNVVPTHKLERGTVLRDDVSYESLEKFLPYVEVELVGLGTYVKGDDALAATDGDLELKNWYERDLTIRDEYKF